MSSKAKHAVATAMVAASMAVAGTASSASDIFIKMETIKGESVDNTHKGEIEVLSWSWGMSAAEHLASAGVANRAVGRLDQITFNKKIDGASPGLMQLANKGTHVKEAVLTVRKAGAAQGDYIVIKLHEVFVSTIKESIAGTADGGNEEVTLTFQTCDFTYSPQLKDGRPGSPVTVTLGGPGAIKG
jgi:type VI secretion system secreted protein Hcp